MSVQPVPGQQWHVGHRIPLAKTPSSPPKNRHCSRRWEHAADDLVETRSIADVIGVTLSSAIVDRALPPGWRLREERLASLFNVSRTPIREALAGLASATSRAATTAARSASDRSPPSRSSTSTPSAAGSRGCPPHWPPTRRHRERSTVSASSTARASARPRRATPRASRRRTTSSISRWPRARGTSSSRASSATSKTGSSASHHDSRLPRPTGDRARRARGDPLCDRESRPRARGAARPSSYISVAEEIRMQMLFGDSPPGASDH